ncbi:tripartite tricarboxylate transporter substrate binding protein [Pollutimonas bauzanensis]|uniref:Bug family tripartite tricarboxylate transporter substrate binding protein n=1 Tax=Pollutimonas bauzanensis TaxID=658167 RepID=UPI00333EB39E
MKLFRKALAALALISISAAVLAEYPDRSVRWIVPFPAGGGTDVVSRLLAQPMGGALGQTFVVDNRPGAGTMIGAEAVANAKSDGYTIGTLDVSTVALNPSLYDQVRYNPATDFEYIGGTARFPFVLVVNLSVPVNDLQELIDLAKKMPGKLTYATPGLGGPNHLGMELFQQKAGVKLLHVPYRGDAPALQDLIGGQIDMYLVNTAASLPYISSGKVKAIAIAMKMRSDALPDVPTFSEAGVPEFEAYAWQGLAAPAGTPKPIVAQLSRELRSALADDGIKQRLADMGVEPFSLSPDEFTAHVQAQGKLWGEIIRKAGIRLSNN